MKYPLSTEYQTSVKYCDRFVLDPILSKGYPQNTKFGLLMYSGGYTRVFPITVGTKKYALRCWIAEVHEAEYRYEQLKHYIHNRQLTYFVPFDYIQKGILVNGNVYPILRMEWAEGNDLKSFIQKNLNNPDILRRAANTFLKMTKTLHKHKIAHGDLQHENIIVQNVQNNLEFILIDYDSLYIPNFASMPDHIVGLPAFQHPNRIKNAHQAKASEKVDYFSELVIYVTLLALSERPDLWDIFKVDTADGLIFTQLDYENPDKSNAFSLLDHLSHSICVGLKMLKSYCKQPDINQFIPVEQVIIGHDDCLNKMFKRIDMFSRSIPEKKQHVSIVANQKVDQLIQNIQHYSLPEKTGSIKPECGVDQLLKNIQSA